MYTGMSPILLQASMHPYCIMAGALSYISQVCVIDCTKNANIGETRSFLYYLSCSRTFKQYWLLTKGYWTVIPSQWHHTTIMLTGSKTLRECGKVVLSWSVMCLICFGWATVIFLTMLSYHNLQERVSTIK